MNFIKAIANYIWEFVCAIGRAKYAAELARAHKYKEARALMEK